MKKRSVIPNILILTEGETEKIYLSHLRERGTNYSIHVRSYGGSGAMKILKSCETTFKTMAMNRTRGDIAICVLDVDENTIEDLEEAIAYAERKKILLIVSNPCIEAFFMLHFRDDVPNVSSSEMKELLSKHIKDYKETGDHWQLLLKNRDEAIKKSRKFKLSIDCIKQGISGSNIYELFDLIERIKKKN